MVIADCINVSLNGSNLLFGFRFSYKNSREQMVPAEKKSKNASCREKEQRFGLKLYTCFSSFLIKLDL